MPQLLPYGKESQHSLPVRDHSPDLLEGNGSYSKCLKAYPLSDPQHLSLHLYFLLEKKKKKIVQARTWQPAQHLFRKSLLTNKISMPSRFPRALGTWHYCWPDLCVHELECGWEEQDNYIHLAEVDISLKSSVRHIAKLENHTHSFQLWESLFSSAPWGSQSSLCFLFSQLLVTV